MNNLTGQKFVRLRVIGAFGRTPAGRIRWMCQCDCGRTIIVDGIDLRRAKTMSCGCARSRPLTAGEDLARKKLVLEPRFVPRKRACKGPDRRFAARDLSGRRFGRLTAKRFDHRDRQRKDYWYCVCICGRWRVVRGQKLLSGAAVSCGCKKCKGKGG